MRLPYNKKTAQTYVYASPEFYASQCYIVAIQDVRGQYASQGVFYAFQNEMQDGYDSVEWSACMASRMSERRSGWLRSSGRRIWS